MEGRELVFQPCMQGSRRQGRAAGRRPSLFGGAETDEIHAQIKGRPAEGLEVRIRGT